MNGIATYVRGWCPGALRPMASGDGLIVRVRPRAGALVLPAIIAICEAAARHGNGHFDLTRRANLQIRGVREDTLQPLLDVLAANDLLDATPQGEAVRNVIVSPLAGADARELIDMRPLAGAIEAALASDERLWMLPPKFGFVLDGGGALSLDSVRADVRLKAVRGEPQPAIDLTISGRERVRESADGAVAAVIRSLIPGSTSTPPYGEWTGAMGRAAQIRSRAIAEAKRPSRDEQDRAPLGLLTATQCHHPLAIAAPFGRIEAHILGRIAREAIEAGCTELRLSPWRALYLIAPSRAAAVHLVARARDSSLIVDAEDPLLRVDACPGSPACSSGKRATRDVAQRIAAMMPALDSVSSVHVSGCAKGCARSGAADLVLVAEREGFAVIREGRADGIAEFTISAQDLDALPALLARPVEARCHA